MPRLFRKFNPSKSTITSNKLNKNNEFSVKKFENSKTY
jgi:hypothetical protein